MLNSTAPGFYRRATLAALLISTSNACRPALRVAAPHAQRTPSNATAQPPATALSFSELYAADADSLFPSATALGLAGKRVRMVGFMASMELALPGAFYLTRRPVSCDEAGGGTADLPPDSVLVRVAFANDALLPHVDGPIEATGLFEVGNQVDAAGRASSFRIRLDAPQSGRFPGHTSGDETHAELKRRGMP